MKKLILLIIIMRSMLWESTQAQPVSSYGFESKTGTFEEVTGGAIVGKNLLAGTLRSVSFAGGEAPFKELAVSEGLPVGFDFVFNNSAMNKFAIGSDGYIVLGRNQVTIDPRNGGSMLGAMAEGKHNIIGLTTNRGVAGLESTEISYRTTGTSPNRILTVQFKNLGMLYGVWYEGTTDFTSVNLQIRLYETSNKIEIIFKNWINSSTRTVTARVGIKGSIENDRLLVESKNNSWEETLPTTKEVAMMNWSSKAYPTDGLTYIFTPPANCEVPNTLLTGLKLTSSSNGVKGDFLASPAADYYLKVMTQTEKLSSAPVDGNYYKAGDQLGNGTVVAFDTLTTFATQESLSGNKPYYFHIFATNTFCQYGPKYNINNPLKGNIVTLPDKPALAVVDKGYDKIVLSAAKNQAGNNVLVAMTQTPAKSAFDAILIDGEFGQPAGELNVGDIIEGGGTVIYKGDGIHTLNVDGLSDYTLYHFKAWSYDENGVYSSIGTTANESTWGKVPFIPDFTKMPDFNVPPHGWESETFRLIYDKSNKVNQLMCEISSVDPIGGIENSMTTPWILLKEGLNKVQFSCNLTLNKLLYEWGIKDYLEVQVSEDNQKFETIFTIDKDNAPEFVTVSDFITYIPVIKNYGGKRVKVRFNWKCHATVRLLIQDFKIVEKPACDQPVNVRVDGSSVVGNKAMIKWTSAGDESVWDIRYRKAGSDRWETPVEVRQNPYLMTSLPINTYLELQVRAKCSLTSFSDWSESLLFTTGYATPFLEEFNTNTLPTGWRLENGLLSESTVFCTGTGISCPKNWRFYKNALTILYSTKPKDWVITPKLDLGDGSYHGKLAFDLKLSKTNSNPTPEDIRFTVVIAKDGEQAFMEKNVIMELKKADFESMADSTRYTVDLSGYSGIVRLGFYAFTQTTKAGESLILDNVALVESCPAVSTVTVSDVTENSAVISWEGVSEEWLTFIRKAGSAKKDYQKRTETKWTLTDLSPQTTYEVGISKTCAPNDTARAVIASFSTQSVIPCAVPINISATASQKFVTLVWEGDGINYNIRFRRSGDEDWVNKSSTGSPAQIDGLDTEVEYEYSLQSVCSVATGDVSDWSPVTKVKTLPVTCFAPEKASIVPAFNSAEISWSGQADQYQLHLSENGKEWISYEIKNKEEYTLEDLKPITKYSIRLRSICSAGDSSEWSTVTDFKTTEIPECVVPFDLQVTGITDTTAALNWNADTGNIFWSLRYREGSATQWNTVDRLTEKQYLIDGLSGNTAYLWSVKAACDGERTSAWSVQNRFTTQTSDIAETDGSGLKAFVSNGVINLINPQGIHIVKVCLFDADGKLLKEYLLNSNENVWMPVSTEMRYIVMKVYGNTAVYTYPLMKK